MLEQQNTTQLNSDEQVSVLTNQVSNKIYDFSHAIPPQITLNQLCGFETTLKTVVLRANTSLPTHMFSFRVNTKEIKDLLPVQVTDFYRFMKFDLVFKFEITSVFQQVGALIVYFNNAFTSDRVVSNNNSGTINGRHFNSLGSYEDPFTGFFLPHKIITLGRDSVTDLAIPWSFNREMLPIDDPSRYCSGAICLDVLSPLTVATGVTNTVDIRIRLAIPNIEFARYLTDK
jgi:hypothetical protein